MGYVKSFDREKEIEILTRIAKQMSSIAGKRSGLARARNHLKKAQDELENLKRELFVCRFGEAALTSRIANAGKAREKLAAKRAAAPFAVAPVGPPSVPFAQVVPPTVEPTQRIVVPGPVAAERSTDNQHECTRCGQAITVRGLCACPGVRHRAVRKLNKGPNISIKHPPVPAFQMGAEKVELS